MKTAKLFIVALILLAVTRVAPAWSAEAGALKSYVAKPDASYQWTKRSEKEIGGIKIVELQMTSQTWKDIVWKHQVLVCRPEGEIANASQAVLLISGGSWREELEKPPTADAKLPGEVAILAQVAKQIKAPVVLLSQVPFQPVFDGMTEDEIISFTFEQFLKTQDAEWPLLLPMVKAAVRAMDTAQAFAKEEWNLEIKNFTVTGASKRGWTTWLTGAVEPRATAIAPIVIDTLNMPAQMKHQLESWDEFSEQIQDYTRRGIQQHMDTPAGKTLESIVDPYNYRHVLTQPKLLIMGTNDRYWTLDACNLYWKDLVGEKHLLYVPNKGHGIDDYQRLVGSIAALHRQAAGQLVLPNLEWQTDEVDGKLTITIKSDVQPEKVQAWIATAPTRDFREVKWTAQPAAPADGQFKLELAIPSAGFAAMFGEAVYKADGLTYFLSTNVRIVGEPQAAAAAAGK